MERSRYSYWVSLIMLLILNLERCGGHWSDRQLYEDLKIRFEGKHAQIEVGGPYAGIEMHNSAPAINRISFYYPVANSLDLSRDYWQRERDHVFFIGLKWKGEKRWIGLDPMPFEITPYSAVFLSEEQGRIVRISYNFCYNSPTLVIQIQFTNCSREEQTFEIYTPLATSLRTCHTYRLIDRAWTEVSAD